MIQLIERFYDPTDGSIVYNGMDVKNLDNRWYHQKQLAIVGQEPVLFSGSIRDNILYGVDVDGMKEEEIEEKLMSACKAAMVTTFIEDKKLFPEGVKSDVGERGGKLSGG